MPSQQHSSAVGGNNSQPAGAQIGCSVGKKQTAAAAATRLISSARYLVGRWEQVPAAPRAGALHTLPPAHLRPITPPTWRSDTVERARAHTHGCRNCMVRISRRAQSTARHGTAKRALHSTTGALIKIRLAPTASALSFHRRNPLLYDSRHLLRGFTAERGRNGLVFPVPLI